MNFENCETAPSEKSETLKLIFNILPFTVYHNRLSNHDKNPTGGGTLYIKVKVGHTDKFSDYF